MSRKKNLIKHETVENADCDELLVNDLFGLPYMPPQKGTVYLSSRDDNPVVFLEIKACGGRMLSNGERSKPEVLGKLFFELRKDLVPVACSNFLTLCSGLKGQGDDGIIYHYKGIRLHRIVKDGLFQSGDLLDSKGDCSRSIYNNGGLFRDENFIFRHTGAGCLSYCNRGPDTNGSLFQVCFTQNSDLDDKYVVFGCLASKESFECLSRINLLGTYCGEPKEEVIISDCGVAFER
jgi:cyclophilin family peptidyl-prolyl cis-trans isomerase